MFADDIILFITKLSNSVPAILDVIKSFGHFSGYKVNNTKSSLMLLNENERNSPGGHVSMFNSVDSFIYLGINIVPDVGKMVQVNYDPILQSIYDSLERWTSMPISLIGRINLLKMNVLPKLLYLFQNIPLPLPLSYFTKLKKTCSNLSGAIDDTGYV